jgi:DNA-binding CsgD family transcriptional regulator
VLLFLFDMDDVLYDYDYATRMARLSAATGVADHDLRTRWWKAGHEHIAEAGGYATAEAYLAAFAAAVGASEGAAPPGPVPSHPPLGVPPETEVESPPHADEPDVVLFHRFAEVAAGIWWAPVPMLLAAPTMDDGTLDAGELASRLAAFEAAGCRPWPHDLLQALLRVAPEDRPALHDAVQRIAGGTGASILAWLADGASADGLSKLPPELAEIWSRLWTFTEPPHSFGRAREWSTHWAWMLPFARDVIAAHLGVPREAVIEALTASGHFSPQSLDAPSGASGRPLVETFVGGGDDFTASDDLMTAAAGCATLTDDEKHLLRLRYYDDLTQQRIAEQIGVSQMQVSRRLASILAKIREGSAIAGAA